MPDDTPDAPAATPERTPEAVVPVEDNVPAPEDRAELLLRARTFLTSPQVQNEDVAAKRRFLVEKGLNDSEVEGLLRELPPPAPSIPPRTYPQPPPSNLPNLLAGIFRITSWIAGGSAALLLMYFRFIYPRIAQTFQARLSLRKHQEDLLGRLTQSIESVKASQQEAFAVLPRPIEYREEPKYAQCISLVDVDCVAGDSHDVPHTSLLRIAVQELLSKKVRPTADAIFQLLEEKFPWIQSENDGKFETELWDTLSTSPFFEQQDENDIVTWSFNPPEPPSPAPLVTSLSALQTSLPEKGSCHVAIEKTAQALSDFTGYLASQTYNSHSNYHVTAAGTTSWLSPEEEELRREIRALKGLVLNRRSFLPPRPPAISLPSSVRPS